MPPRALAPSLARLLDEIWQDKLRHEPEYATYLGDKRYDTELTDFSPRAVNDTLERERGYIDRLSAIDTTGLTHQEQLSAELQLRSLVEDQEGARFKEWEMPVTQYDGLQLDLPQLAEHTAFDTADDYDHYATRLGKVAAAFSQIMTNMQSGVDEQRTPPAYIMQKVLVQVQAIAAEKPEDTPFAEPLKKFPAAVSAEDRKRISDEVLNAIATQVLPSYARFAKFLSVAYIPNCRKDPGVWALPDDDAYYAFRIKQSTTLNKTAAEIHQIGVDEVKRDEAEMLAIAQKMGSSGPEELWRGAEGESESCTQHLQTRYLAQRRTGATSRRWSSKLPQLFGDNAAPRRSWRWCRYRRTWRRTSRRPTTTKARRTAGVRGMWT